MNIFRHHSTLRYIKMSMYFKMAESFDKKLQENYIVTNITYYNEKDNGQLMPSYGYICAAVTLMFIGTFGFFFNLIVIILMLKENLVNNPLNVILFNLVCSDFSVAVLGNPFTFVSAVAHRWVWGTTMCQVYGFFMSLLGITSITTLTVLAFERYMIVCHSFSKYSLTTKGAIFAVFGIWSYSFLLTFPPLIGWGKYVNESANISCSINWDEQSINALTYIIYLFIFGLKVPLAVIIFSYYYILTTIKKLPVFVKSTVGITNKKKPSRSLTLGIYEEGLSSPRINRRYQNYTLTSFFTEYSQLGADAFSNIPNSMQKGQVTKAEDRIAYMILVMVSAFMFAWTPYSIVALIAQFGDASLISPGVSVIPALLAKSSICYNPIIYVGMNTQLRKHLLEMLHLKKSTGSAHIHSESCTTVGISRYISLLGTPSDSNEKPRSKVLKGCEEESKTVLIQKRFDENRVYCEKIKLDKVVETSL